MGIWHIIMIEDILKALKVADRWMLLSWYDIKAKYRRSILGPFWLVIIYLVSSASLGILGSIMMKTDMRSIFPSLAAGLFAWNMFNAVLMESCDVFIRSTFIIQNVRVNLLEFVFRMVSRNLIVAAHTLVVLIIILLFLVGINSNIFWLIPYIALFTINAVFIGVVLGFFTTRFRDVQQLVQSVMSILFFLTPIMWKKEMLADKQFIAYLNPFANFLEILREPLLGNVPSDFAISYCLIFTLVMFILTFFIYKKYQHRLIYWL